jgi:5'-nucleotidase
MVADERDRPHILVTNDDGFSADGIIALRDALRALGDVTIVAPDREQSAASHAVTLRNPLRVTEVSEGVISVDGTPTDCVLLAVNGLLPRRPDYVFSGINHGPNMGDDVSYSGTVAAAIEGTICGIPSVAISRAMSGPGDFSVAAEFAAVLAGMIMERGIPNKSLLNVNVPPVRREEIAGVRIYRDAVVKNLDPRGREYFWIGGERPTWSAEEGSDFDAVDERMISITPIHLDLTDYKTIVHMKNWEFDF